MPERDVERQRQAREAARVVYSSEDAFELLAPLPQPLLVTITLGQGDWDFERLESLLYAFRVIDTEADALADRVLGGRIFRDFYETQMLSFSVGSPARLRCLTDPAWLCLFLMLAMGYSDLKKSIAEAHRDLTRAARVVQDLSDDARRALDTYLREAMRHYEEQPTSVSEQTLAKLRTARKVLRSESQALIVRAQDVSTRPPRSDTSWLDDEEETEQA